MHKINIEILTQHFLIAAEWADYPDDAEHPCEGFDPESIEAAKEYCARFAAVLESNGCWSEILQRPEYWQHPDCENKPEAALGHDLWLTSQGHGAGFWDRKALESGGLGGKLSGLVGYNTGFPPMEHWEENGVMFLE